MKIKCIASALILSCVFLSCSKSTTEDISAVTVPKDTKNDTTTTSKVTYKSDVKEIIDVNCVGCHGNIGGGGGVALVTYTQVKNSAQNGRLINVMNGEAPIMPPAPLEKLPQATLDLIDQWKADGFLEE